MELAHGHTKVGAFTTEMAVIGELHEPMRDPDWHVAGWRREDKHFASMAWRVPGRSDNLGDVALNIYQNPYVRHRVKDPTGKRMVREVLLVLAGQNQGGKIVPWTSPWPCNVEAKTALLTENSRGFTHDVNEEAFSHVEFLNHTHLIGWGERRSGELSTRRFAAFCYIWFAMWLAFLCSKDL
eukprot:3220266-Amphidinium_carterae.1